MFYKYAYLIPKWYVFLGYTQKSKRMQTFKESETPSIFIVTLSANQKTLYSILQRK